MANHVNANIVVHANDEALEHFSQKLEKGNESLWSYFIEEKDWTRDFQDQMIGPKWALIVDTDVNQITTTSAWAPPMEFCQNLYDELRTLDPLVEITMTYEDECPNYIGAYVINQNGEYNEDLDYDELVELVKVEYPDINESENWDEEGDFSDRGLDLFQDVMWDIVANWQYEYIAENEVETYGSSDAK